MEKLGTFEAYKEAENKIIRAEDELYELMAKQIIIENFICDMREKQVQLINDIIVKD